MVIRHPFLLRTVSPPIVECEERIVKALHRVGKQIVVELDGNLFVAIHLMIAGRLAWLPRERGGLTAPGGAVGRAGGAGPSGGRGGKGLLGEIEFSTGTLRITEAGTQRRAALRILAGTDALSTLDRGGRDLLVSTTEELAQVLRRESHTLKRALTDPRLISGVGNAYSDEILHAARLSPFVRTATLSDGQIVALHEAARTVLAAWTDRLRTERAGGFPRKVTAFHPAMAVHGKYGEPCPDCGTPIQRIRYAENESNYCPRCQTDGKVYADRALSRLLKGDWPRSVEELERLPGFERPSDPGMPPRPGSR
jgi:formamidopyrimidine-DNA glycosylase